MAYHPGVGVDNLAVRLPPHFLKSLEQLVRFIGHINGYSLIKQRFGFLGMIYQGVN